MKPGNKEFFPQPPQTPTTDFKIQALRQQGLNTSLILALANMQKLKRSEKVQGGIRPDGVTSVAGIWTSNRDWCFQQQPLSIYYVPCT